MPPSTYQCRGGPRSGDRGSGLPDPESSPGRGRGSVPGALAPAGGQHQERAPMSIMSAVSRPNRARRGFTLVELAVVVVIIGVLAAFGVPRFLQSVERSKASEAFGYLSAFRS